MINAWSLLYDELYGDDEMTDKTILLIITN